MQESHLLKLCDVEVQTANPPQSRGQTSYISQRYGIVQPKYNDCEVSPIGFDEGLHDPPNQWEGQCQGDR